MTFDEEEWYNSDYYDFHAKVSIQLGELIKSGLFDWENDETLKWDYYTEEQYNRVMKKFVNRYFYREIGALPYKKWALFFVRKMNEIMPKYKILYAALDGGMNPFQDSSTTSDGKKRVDDTSNDNGTRNTTDEANNNGTEHVTDNFSETVTDNGTSNVNDNKTSETNATETLNSDKYGKSRDVHSDFPATQLGNNQDYADNSTDKQYEDIENRTTTTTSTTTETGKSETTTSDTKKTTSEDVKDTEWQDNHTGNEDITYQDNHTGAQDTKTNNVSVELGSYLDKALQVQQEYNDIDVMILEDCNVLFSSLYSVSINGIM